MNLRIMGTSEEVKELVKLLPAILDVKNVSKEYPNRCSEDVRVYVDCAVETGPFTEAMKKNAEYKTQLGAMLIIGSTSKGQILETHAAILSKSFLALISYILSDQFIDSLKSHMKEFEHSIEDSIKGTTVV